MRRIKFSILSVLAMVLLISISGTSFAQGENLASKSEAINLGEARYFDAETGQTLTAIYEVTDDGFKEISSEEFKAQRAEQQKLAKKVSELENAKLTSEITPFVLFNFYFPSYTTDPYMGNPYPVTNEMQCPSSNTVPCAIARQFSATETESFSANVTSDMTDSIKATAGFTWTQSASLSSTYTITIKPGSKGVIMFKPYFKYTYGELKWYSNGWYVSSEWVSGKSPKTLNGGELAGLVYGVVN